MSVPGAKKYVGGIAVHWYLDFWVSPYLLDLTHEKYPNLPIFYTEACVGQLKPQNLDDSCNLN